MNSIHVEDWKKHNGLIMAILKAFEDNGVTFDFGLWCPETWKGLKGETMCADAKFHVIMEAQALRAWQDATFLHKQLTDIADEHGCYWEQGFHWSIHLYKK